MGDLRMRVSYVVVATALLTASCVSSSSSTSSVIGVGATPVPNAGPQAGWRSLFDGTTLNAWRGYKSAEAPAGWRVVDGVIVKEKGAEDLMTRDQFANFELDLDWKLAKGGNAGIFYRGTQEYDHIYWSAPEYQLLDDANHPDGKSRLTSAGAAYALYPSPAGVVKPANEWNSSLIAVNGNHVQHWL